MQLYSKLLPLILLVLQGCARREPVDENVLAKAYSQDVGKATKVPYDDVGNGSQDEVNSAQLNALEQNDAGQIHPKQDPR